MRRDNGYKFPKHLSVTLQRDTPLIFLVQFVALYGYAADQTRYYTQTVVRYGVLYTQSRV